MNPNNYNNYHSCKWNDCHSCYRPVSVSDKFANILRSISTLFKLYNTITPEHGSFWLLGTDNEQTILNGASIPFDATSDTNTSKVFLGANDTIVVNTAGVYEVSFTVVPEVNPNSNDNNTNTGTPISAIFEAYRIPSGGGQGTPIIESQILSYGTVDATLSNVQSVADDPATVYVDVNMTKSISKTFHVALASGEGIQIINSSGYQISLYGANKDFPVALITLNRIGPLVS